MADTQASAAPAADGDQADNQDESGGGWGRVLDTAGILAGAVLVVIVIDIFSDGRLISRRLRREPGPDTPAGQDQQDQQDQDAGP